MSPSLPAPRDDVAYWRSLERTLIILRFVGVLLFSPVLLLQSGLEWPATLAFTLAYNLVLLALLHRVSPTRLGLAATALDLVAMTGFLAALGAGIPYTSIYLLVIVPSAGRFGPRGALGIWALTVLLYLELIATDQIPAPQPTEGAFQVALWLITGLIVGEISHRLHQSRETALLAGELRASREQAEAALAREQHQRQVAETLQQLALELNAELDEQRILERTLELAGRVVPGDSGRIWLIEGGEAVVTAIHGAPAGPWQRADRRPLAELPTVRHLIETRAPLRLGHLQADARFVGIPADSAPRSYLAVPLLVGGQAIGAVTNTCPGLGVYTEDHERALQALAAQAGLAVRKARLIAEERRQRQVAETLHQLALELNAELDEQHILSRTLDMASQVVPCASGVVWLVEGDQVALAAVRGERRAADLGKRQDIAQLPLVRHLLETRQPLRLAHLQAHPLYAGHIEYEEPLSYVGVPLLVRGQAIGILSLRTPGVGLYDEEHERSLMAFAAQAALALRNARLMDAAERHAGEEAALARASAALAAGISLEEASGAFLPELSTFIPFDRVSLSLLEPDGQGVRVRGSAGLERPCLPTGSLVPLSQTAIASCLRSRRTVIFSDLAQEATSPAERALAEEGYRSALFVPLLGSRAGPSGAVAPGFGSINLLSQATGCFGPVEAAVLERVAAHPAGAIEAARVREERDRGAARIVLLQRLTAVANRTIELRQVFDDFAHELRRVVPFDRLTLVLLQDKGETALRYAVWGERGPERVEGSTIALAETGLLAQVLASGQPALRTDIAAESRAPIDRELVARGLRSDALLPLVAGGRTLGALVLGSSSTGAFSSTHLELLGPVAEQLALAVDRSLAYQRAVEQAARLEAVNRVARLVAEGLDLRRTFSAFAAALRPLVPHDRAVLNVLRPGATVMARLVEAALGDEKMAAGSPSTIPLEGSVAGAVLQRGQPLLRRDIGGADPAGDFASGIRSSVLLPLIVGDQALGVLILASRQPGAFQESHLLLLEPLADQLAMAVQNALLHEETRTQAMADVLTGLPNRRHFDQRLEPELQRARRLGYPLGFLFVDMDDFKEINDTLGHQAGDAALGQTGAALAASLRASDFLARWGGDEFVVLLPGVASEELPVVGEKLQQALATLPPYVPAAAGRPLAASMGGAAFPRDADTAEGLVDAADRALLAAKARGGRCLVLAPAGPEPPAP